MQSRTLKTRVRGKLNSVLLNRAFTSTFDRIRPAKSLGDRGERIAERHLLKLGMIICHRSYSDGVGEIDLVAVDEDTIVFVEVKTRTSDYAGMPAEAVDDDKQKRVSQAALSYLKHFDLFDQRVRFDVVSVFWPNNSQLPTIEHFENAFQTAGTSV